MQASQGTSPPNATGPRPPEQAAAIDLIAAVRAYLHYLASTGLDALPSTAIVPRPGAAAPATIKGPPEPTEKPRERRPGPLPPAAAAAPVEPARTDLFVDPGLSEARTLEELRDAIGDCQRCRLAPGRTHLVFGVGNPHAELMFVGEGPGRDEDLKGEPFVGRAGQLLTEIITKGMKMRREDVYIANVVKCRPPENRNPEPDEIAACQPFLRRQIEIVGPKAIVALGTFAAQTLLAVRTPIFRLRGHWHDFHGVKLMPTLHPAYLLRNPADKRLVWADIKMVLAELGITV